MIVIVTAEELLELLELLEVELLTELLLELLLTLLELEEEIELLLELLELTELALLLDETPTPPAEALPPPPQPVSDKPENATNTIIDTRLRMKFSGTFYFTVIEIRTVALYIILAQSPWTPECGGLTTFISTRRRWFQLVAR